jgi:CYTH domain-containing protein
VSFEIERKFLVRDTAMLAGLAGERLVQGWIARTPRATVRVRIGDGRAWLTLKGRSEGISRRELEYPIPLGDAELCIAELCDGPVIEKTRYRLPAGPHTWEVDVFEGDNAGLVLAEIELGHEDEPFARPAWLGEEVSHDPRYYNSNLVSRPYTRW